MIAMWLAILRRDLALLLTGGGRRGGALLPVLFFLSVAILLPFAIGPDAQMLARTGGGIVWVAALLASILPLDRLVEPDLDHGFFDQWALRGLAEEWTMSARIVAHWLTFAPLLMAATVPAAALFNLTGEQLSRVELGLLAGTPGLAALGVMIAAMTAGLRGGAALAGLLLLPMAVPILIFGAGGLQPAGEGGIALAGAVSLLLVAVAPFAAGAAIRAARE